MAGARAVRGGQQSGGEPRALRISLAAWSLHRAIRDGSLRMLDVPRLLRDDFDIGALELVNTLLEVPTAQYVARLAKNATDANVEITLIMCDGEGDLGAADAEARRLAVRNHQKWVYAAADLGCRALRVNWIGPPAGQRAEASSRRAFIDTSAATFHELIDLATPHGIELMVENHGGASEEPELLAELMRRVDSPQLGTLPDFGNFPPGTDIYAAIDRMMPFAKGLSAKCFDFDDAGNETRLDYPRLMRICLDEHRYRGDLGIEFEGERLAEPQGILACRDLLRRLLAQRRTG